MRVTKDQRVMRILNVTLLLQMNFVIK